jgi:hypothetical protein
MGNPNRLISLLPPKVRQAVQAQMDLEAVADLFGLTKEELEMEAQTNITTASKQVSDQIAETELKPNMTVEAARDIWQAVLTRVGSVRDVSYERSAREHAESLRNALKFLRKELGQDESVLLGSFLSSGELSVEGKATGGKTSRSQNKIATGFINGLEINKEAGEVILTGELARRTLFHVVEEKRAEAAHAISKTIALFNVYWTGKGNEERSRAAEKVEEVKRLLNDLVSLADLARELRSSAQFGGTCDEAKEGCPHCPEASQSSQKPRDLQKDTDQGLTDRRS